MEILCFNFSNVPTKSSLVGDLGLYFKYVTRSLLFVIFLQTAFHLGFRVAYFLNATERIFFFETGFKLKNWPIIIIKERKVN